MNYLVNGLFIGCSAYVVKQNVLDIMYGMGGSMLPTVPNGSVIVIDKLSKRWRHYERNDIVLLKSPTRSNGQTVMKRILAFEGDTVHLQPTSEDDESRSIVVPKGHVWVEGDNPKVSVDSRQIGAIPAALVLGRAYLIAWPWAEAKFLR